MSPGIVPVPGDGKSRFQPISVADVATVAARCFADDGDGRGGARPGRAALLDVPRDHGRGPDGARQEARHPADAGRRSSGSSPGTSETIGLPFPVATDQLRQLKLDNIGPLDVIPARFGFEPRPMEGALGYLKSKPRDQTVRAL